MNRRTHVLIAALLLIFSAAAYAQPETLSIGSNRPTTPGRHGVAADEFTPNLGALRRGADELNFQLPGGQVVVLRRDGGEFRSQGDVFWHGTVLFEPGSDVTLTVRRNLLAGAIRKGGDVFEVRPERDRHVVERLNFASFQPCAAPVAPDLAGRTARATAADTPAAATPDGTVAAEGTAEIHLLSMYTPQARDAAGGVAQIEALIQAAVDNGNTAFANSLVNAHYTLVHTALANYNDTGNMSADLDWVDSDAATASLRNQYGADMVSLIVSNGGSACGIGYVMRSPGPSFAGYAFQVTDMDCAVGNLTFPHEHGHNEGMEHDPANGPAPASASYPWSFGHYLNGVFRTVMSYNNQCPNGCTRVAYFSNPGVSYLGNPTGIADQRDNARTGNLTAPIIAAFRSAAAATPPAAPSALGATAISSIQINLAWADNASDETGFHVERSTDGVNFTPLATTGANTTTYSNTGLPASTTYYYRVNAYNGAGDSAWSNTANATTAAPPPPPPPGPPAPPTSLTAAAQYSGTGKNKTLVQVNLAYVDNSSDETLFRIERCKASGKGASQVCTFGALATVGANVTTYADPKASLSGSGTYKYRVRSESGGGVSAWAQAQVNVQ